MSIEPEIAAIATAVPPFVLHREDVARRARPLFGAGRDFDRMLPIYANSGIERRHSCVPIEWYLEPRGWAERNRLFIANALDLGEGAVRQCLERAGRGPDEIDALVVVSTTGIATPSLDALLMERMGLRPDLRRLPLFGFGCAGGVLGLSRAAALARSEPGRRVMLVVVELCGLTFRANDPSKSNLVATALFGDGCAAVLLESGCGGPRLGVFGEHTWPHSLDVMGWRVEDDGFGVLFSADIPSLLRRGLREAVDRFLAGHGTGRADLAGHICHPGGAKVVAALEEALDIPGGALAVEREVLREFGNMSAATVLFVLERRLAALKPDARYLLTGVGPGFTAGFQVLETA